MRVTAALALVLLTGCGGGDASITAADASSPPSAEDVVAPSTPPAPTAAPPPATPSPSPSAPAPPTPSEPSIPEPPGGGFVVMAPPAPEATPPAYRGPDPDAAFADVTSATVTVGDPIHAEIEVAGTAPGGVWVAPTVTLYTGHDGATFDVSAGESPGAGVTVTIGGGSGPTPCEGGTSEADDATGRLTLTFPRSCVDLPAGFLSTAGMSVAAGVTAGNGGGDTWQDRVSAWAQDVSTPGSDTVELSNSQVPTSIRQDAETPFAALAWVHLAPGDPVQITAQWGGPLPDGHSPLLSFSYGSTGVVAVRVIDLGAGLELEFERSGTAGSGQTPCPDALMDLDAAVGQLRLTIPVSCLSLDEAAPVSWRSTVLSADGGAWTSALHDPTPIDWAALPEA